MEKKSHCSESWISFIFIPFSEHPVFLVPFILAVIKGQTFSEFAIKYMEVKSAFITQFIFS